MSADSIPPPLPYSPSKRQRLEKKACDIVMRECRRLTAGGPPFIPPGPGKMEQLAEELVRNGASNLWDAAMLLKLASHTLAIAIDMEE